MLHGLGGDKEPYHLAGWIVSLDTNRWLKMAHSKSLREYTDRDSAGVFFKLSLTSMNNRVSTTSYMGFRLERNVFTNMFTYPFFTLYKRAEIDLGIKDDNDLFTLLRSHSLKTPRYF